MSDTLRAKETDDVLSSIRRLVSAEPRQMSQKGQKPLVLTQPQAQAQAQVQAPVQAQTGAQTGAQTEVPPAAAAGLQIKTPEEGKLVLGPALRVSQEGALNPLLLGRKAAAPLPPEPQPQPQPVAVAVAPEPTPEPTPESRNIAFGANVTAFPKAAEPSALASRPEEIAPEAFLSDEVAPEEVEDAPFIEILDDLPQTAEVTPFPRAAEAAAVQNMPEPLADNVAPEAEPAPAFEPEFDAGPEGPQDDDLALEPEGEEEEPRGHWSGQDLPEVGWIAEAGSEWDDEESQAFEAYKRQFALPETDEPSPEWADAAEAEVRAQLQAPPMQTGELVGPADQINMFHPPALDDSALRDVVRQIIREELSGSLGERITRNVRKLVRIEVNRALTNSTLE